MTQSTSKPIAGYVLIGLGVLFLLLQITGASVFGTLWPLIVMLPGLAFLYGALTGGAKESGMAIPGSIITGIGGILMFQNLTGHWESWAYAWALIPLFLGLGLTFVGQRKNEPKTIQTGQGFVRWSGLGFIVLAAMFELMIFGGGGFLSNLLVPALLIGGGFLMLRQRRHPSEPVKIKNEVSIPYAASSRLSDEKPKRDSVLVGDALQKRIDEALAEPDSSDQEPKA